MKGCGSLKTILQTYYLEKHIVGFSFVNNIK